jgi:hypothetical protein
MSRGAKKTLETGVRRAELRALFVSDALRAEQEVAKYGEVYEMDAVHQHFQDNLAGRNPKPLKASSLRQQYEPGEI